MAFDPSEFDHDYKKRSLRKQLEKSLGKDVETRVDSKLQQNLADHLPDHLDDNLEEYKTTLKLNVEETVGKKPMTTGGKAWRLYLNLLRVHLVVAFPVGILATLLFITMTTEPTAILISLTGRGLYLWTQYYIWSCRNEFSNKIRHRILWICLGFPVSYAWLVMFPAAMMMALVQSFVVAIITQIW